ncbi:hypothetical protein [Curtobacterium sp. PhB115]|uniref:hypothetical protein n=1 Tax=Curtobacterium sp. PhB115 TaxID=2485173 RepID=UPI000F4C5276|nr:hypothetical protein [Curtobacterium sp. PhB115]ROP72260.1 hypothetical protein EDF19_1275 [Curtobacterium sp. PhB115]
MGDLTVDLRVMQEVSRAVEHAAAEFRAERPLSSADDGAFGSGTVSTAFTASATAHDAMTRSLGDDADTLCGFVSDAADAVLRADAELAWGVR